MALVNLTLQDAHGASGIDTFANICQPDPLIIGTGFVIEFGQCDFAIDTPVKGSPSSPLFMSTGI